MKMDDVIQNKEGKTIINTLGKKGWSRNFFQIAVIFVGFYFLIFQPSTVEAHATLLEMEPAERVVIEDPPSTLMLRFNEPIEHDLAMVTVYDWNAKPIFTSNPDGEIDRAPLLEFSLPELKQGTYTVKWEVVSADGHPVTGSYAFSVGKVTEGGIKPVGGGNNAEVGLIFARFVTEGLLLLGAGLFWFGLLAERRKFPSLDSIWKRGRKVGAAFIILGTVTELITYGLSLPPGIIQVVFNGRWELLQQFPFVLMLCAQVLFLILLYIPGMMRGWYLVLWLVLAVTPAFGGHIWGMKNPFIALLPRIFHQIAIAWWLGALCYLILLLIWQKKQDKTISWKAFRAFFVKQMMVASGLVILSGVIMVYLQTGITAVFTDWKTWSTIVIVKVILSLVMVSLAIYQTLKWRKLGKFTTIRLVRTEWTIGLIIIILGVWMSQIAYPIAIKTYDETLITNQVEAELHMDQLKMGNQKMIASLTELDGENPDKVTVEVSMPRHDMGSGELTLEQEDSGDYTTHVPFTMPGTWLIELTATYPNGKKIEWTDEIFIAGSGN